LNGQPQLEVFDGLADGYDQSFTERAPGQWLRSMVFRQVSSLLPASATILEVGCGTGEDAVRFAELGHSVIATDISRAMLEQARQKIAKAAPDVRDRVQTHLLDAAAPGQASLGSDAHLDLVFSNFGALNCVADMGPLFDYANERLNPGLLMGNAWIHAARRLAASDPALVRQQPVSGGRDNANHSLPNSCCCEA